MRNLKAATALLVIFVLGALAVAAEDTTDGKAEQPAFFAEQTRVELGTVKAGQDAVATFVFRNNGEVPVKILKAKPS